jgi:hypothetical protein
MDRSVESVTAPGVSNASAAPSTSLPSPTGVRPPATKPFNGSLFPSGTHSAAVEKLSKASPATPASSPAADTAGFPQPAQSISMGMSHSLKRKREDGESSPDPERATKKRELTRVNAQSLCVTKEVSTKEALEKVGPKKETPKKKKVLKVFGKKGDEVSFTAIATSASSSAPLPAIAPSAALAASTQTDPSPSNRMDMSMDGTAPVSTNMSTGALVQIPPSTQSAQALEDMQGPRTVELSAIDLSTPEDYVYPEHPSGPSKEEYHMMGGAGPAGTYEHGFMEPATSSAPAGDAITSADLAPTTEESSAPVTRAAELPVVATGSAPQVLEATKEETSSSPVVGHASSSEVAFQAPEAADLAKTPPMSKADRKETVPTPILYTAPWKPREPLKTEAHRQHWRIACKFFLTNFCTKGDECVYGHDPRFKQDPYWKQSGKLKSKELCKYFLTEDGCKSSSDECYYVHDLAEKAKATAAREAWVQANPKWAAALRVAKEARKAASACKVPGPIPDEPETEPYECGCFPPEDMWCEASQIVIPPIPTARQFMSAEELQEEKRRLQLMKRRRVKFVEMTNAKSFKLLGKIDAARRAGGTLPAAAPATPGAMVSTGAQASFDPPTGPQVNLYMEPWRALSPTLDSQPKKTASLDVDDTKQSVTASDTAMDAQPEGNPKPRRAIYQSTGTQTYPCRDQQAWQDLHGRPYNSEIDAPRLTGDEKPTVPPHRYGSPFLGAERKDTVETEEHGFQTMGYVEQEARLQFAKEKAGKHAAELSKITMAEGCGLIVVVSNDKLIQHSEGIRPPVVLNYDDEKEVYPRAPNVLSTHPALQKKQSDRELMPPPLPKKDNREVMPPLENGSTPPRPSKTRKTKDTRKNTIQQLRNEPTLAMTRRRSSPVAAVERDDDLIDSTSLETAEEREQREAEIGEAHRRIDSLKQLPKDDPHFEASIPLSGQDLSQEELVQVKRLKRLQHFAAWGGSTPLPPSEKMLQKKAPPPPTTEQKGEFTVLIPAGGPKYTRENPRRVGKAVTTTPTAPSPANKRPRDEDVEDVNAPRSKQAMTEKPSSAVHQFDARVAAPTPSSNKRTRGPEAEEVAYPKSKRNKMVEQSSLLSVPTHSERKRDGHNKGVASLQPQPKRTETKKQPMKGPEIDTGVAAPTSPSSNKSQRKEDEKKAVTLPEPKRFKTEKRSLPSGPPASIKGASQQKTIPTGPKNAAPTGPRKKLTPRNVGPYRPPQQRGNGGNRSGQGCRDSHERAGHGRDGNERDDGGRDNHGRDSRGHGGDPRQYYGGYYGGSRNRY